MPKPKQRQAAVQRYIDALNAQDRITAMRACFGPNNISHG